MIKKLYLFCILISFGFASTASAAMSWNPLPDESYTRTHNALLLSVNILNVIDLSQTVRALEGCGGKCVGLYKEANPFLGAKPGRGRLIAQKAVGMYALGVMTKNMRPQYRTASLVLVNLILTGAVISNGGKAGIGFKIGF